MAPADTTHLEAMAMHLSVIARSMHNQWKTGTSPRIQQWMDFKRVIDQYDAAVLPFVSRPSIMRDSANKPLLSSSLKLWNVAVKIHYEWRHAIAPAAADWLDLNDALDEYELSCYAFDADTTTQHVA